MSDVWYWYCLLSIPAEFSIYSFLAVFIEREHVTLFVRFIAS